MQKNTAFRQVRGVILGLALVGCLSVAASASPLVAGADHSGENHQNEVHAFQVLDGIILANANLRNTDFARTSFVDAIFTDAMLRDARFGSANLARVLFGGANVRDASFFGANLIGADLSGVVQANRATWTLATYSLSTLLPAGFDPNAAGMIFVPEPSPASMLTLMSLGLFATALHRRRLTGATQPGTRS